MSNPTSQSRIKISLKALRSDAGAYAVMFAVILPTLLLPLIAFTLDLSNLRNAGNKLQSDVENAAVAGTVALHSAPHSTSTQQAAARVQSATAARSVMTSNGWNSANTSVYWQSRVASSCYSSSVRHSASVKTFFGGIIGFPTLTVTRSAMAIYHEEITSGDDDDNDDNDGDHESDDNNYHDDDDDGGHDNRDGSRAFGLPTLTGQADTYQADGSLGGDQVLEMNGSRNPVQLSSSLLKLDGDSYSSPQPCTVGTTTRWTFNGQSANPNFPLGEIEILS